MLKSCERPGCGNQFSAQRSTAKYCSSSCRAKASLDPQPVVQISQRLVGLVDSVRERVEAAGLAGTVDGVSAVALAGRMESALNDSAYASLHRQLLVAMDRIDALAPRQGAVDELRLRRDRKRARPA